MKKEKDIINDDDYINYVSEEITNFLIESNVELVNYIKTDDFESAVIMRDAITLFILDTSKILHEATSIRLQKLLNHFNAQNDYLRDAMIKEMIRVSKLNKR